jgi:hypothetical protein
MEKAADFTSFFKSEKEVETAIRECVEKARASGTDGAYMAVPERIQILSNVYKICKFMSKGCRAKVTYELHQPFEYMGSVTITAPSLRYSSSEWFLKVVELASNVEIYARTDGKINVDLTFYGLAESI